MSGIGFWEFFFLCMIGLVVLGPKRLPQVASQLGSWIGQARRMTRALKRQLEDELDIDEELNIRPNIDPAGHTPPRDDDSFSPLHRQPTVATTAAPDVMLADADDTAIGDDTSGGDDIHETPETDRDQRDT